MHNKSRSRFPLIPYYLGFTHVWPHVDILSVRHRFVDLPTKQATVFEPGMEGEPLTQLQFPYTTISAGIRGTS